MACECTTVVRGQHSSRSPMKAGGPTHASIFSRLGLFYKHKHLVLMPDQAASFKHLGGTIRHGSQRPHAVLKQAMLWHLAATVPDASQQQACVTMPCATSSMPTSLQLHQGTPPHGFGRRQPSAVSNTHSLLLQLQPQVAHVEPCTQPP